MTNKQTIDGVSRELIERIFHEGLHSVGFGCKSASEELRDLLDKPPTGYVPCSPKLLESGVDCATAPRWSSKEWDGHSHWHPKPVAQQQGEPVAEIVELGKGLKEVAWRKGRMPELGTKLFANPAAPVAVLLPERREPSASNPHLSDADHEYNSALDEVARLNGIKP